VGTNDPLCGATPAQIREPYGRLLDASQPAEVAVVAIPSLYGRPSSETNTALADVAAERGINLAALHDLTGCSSDAVHLSATSTSA